jgi:hypothetical protein
VTIEKINFSYPRESLQSVYGTEEMSALELAAATSKKVDECVDLVNGVEQSAIQATAIVDNMQTAQDQFITANSDARAQMIADNQAELTTTQNNKNLALDTFTTDLNNTKSQVTQSANDTIANSTQQITTDVNAKITTMSTDGTLANLINNTLLTDINNKVNADEVVVSSTEPPDANMWCDVVGETTIEIDGSSVIFQVI